MTERLISYDPDTGMETWHSYDPDQDTMVIRTKYNFDRIKRQLDHNKDMYNEPGRGWTPSREMKHVARIPNEVWHHFMINEGIDIYAEENWDRMKRILNDPDWRHLRTSPGTV